jgi:hypothetical protein
MKSSASASTALYSPETFISAPCTHFCQGLSKPQGLLQPEALGTLMKFGYFIGFEPAFSHIKTANTEAMESWSYVWHTKAFRTFITGNSAQLQTAVISRSKT